MTVTGTFNGEPYKIPDGCRLVSDDQWHRTSELARILSDLNRSPAGRHQGDAEYQDPSGVSQGNPLLPVGTHIGFTMTGLHIVVPPRERMHDPEAWVVVP